MNEWDFVGQDSFVGIAPKGSLSRESPPQVLNLNQGVALRSWKG